LLSLFAALCTSLAKFEPEFPKYLAASVKGGELNLNRVLPGQFSDHRNDQVPNDDKAERRRDKQANEKGPRSGIQRA